MAITTPRRRTRDPEGRMPLREHLYELRNRLLKAGIGIALGAMLGWFLYDSLFHALQAPVDAINRSRQVTGGLAPGTAVISMNDIASPFNLKIKLSIYLGIVVSSPIWLYQLWAFIVPGLNKREKRYSMTFVGAAVPLFCAGIWVAWRVLPNAVRFLTEFTPAGVANVVNADDYLTFVTQIFLAFGVAFVIPLLLVALNLVGVLSALSMAKAWRIAVFIIFVFAAIASPSPDAGSMLLLAFPMVGLYMVAVGIAWVIDARRVRKAVKEGFAGLDDDEASPLDLHAEPVEAPEDPPLHYDDVT